MTAVSKNFHRLPNKHTHCQIVSNSHLHYFINYYPFSHKSLFNYFSFVCSHLSKNMPKKFAGENSKAVAARQRKENIKLEQDQKVKKMMEDAEWEDNDDKLKKKQQKKEAEEKKRQEQLQKKAEAKALLEKEMESLKSAPKAAPPPPKITRAQIEKMKEKTIKVEAPKPVPARVVVEETPLEENLNRLQLEGEVAQSVDEAISILSDKADMDRHPEKRLKAAYTAFEEINLPILKAENPSLRLSQLKQMLRKEWLKSPQNPLNQKA